MSTLALRRRSRPPSPAPIVVALLAIAGAASAHDPFEITTVGRLQADRLELIVTMTRSCALALVSSDGRARVSSTPAELAERGAELERAGAELFAVTSRGNELRPRSVRVALSPENEVEFRLTYPAAEPGPLRLVAAHLSRLSEGHGNAMTLQGDDVPTVLRSKFLSTSDPVFDTVLSRSAEGSVPPKSAALPRSSAVSAAFSFPSFGVLLLALACWWLQRAFHVPGSRG
jgi:hypothetical protein